jgi:hypothetical protein
VHARVQRLVSAVKMASVFEECAIEEQDSVVSFYGQESTNFYSWSFRP